MKQAAWPLVRRSALVAATNFDFGAAWRQRREVALLTTSL
jgi:hypothetical protein